MNFTLRDVDPQYIEVIDKKCKEISQRTGSKFSRNDYILQLIRTDSEIDLIEYKKTEFDTAVEKMKLAFEENTSSINELNETYSELLNFLVMNINKD